MSFVNTEVLPVAGGYFLGPNGRVPFNKKAGEESLQQFYKIADVIEKHLLINTFLVGERLTLADIFAAGIYQRPFQYILDKKWRSINPNTARWFETVTNQPIYANSGHPEIILCDEIIKNVPPPKPEGEQQQKKKEKAPKEAPKPKAAAKEADEEEEEDKPAPKPKHPLEALDKPTLILDDWKRKYSNEETREVALPWFWENFKPDEYSLWKVDYKYNDELTMTFMTSNLIGMYQLPTSPNPSP